MVNRLRLFCNFCGKRVHNRLTHFKYQNGQRIFYCSNECYLKHKCPEELQNLQLKCFVCGGDVSDTIRVKNGYKEGRRTFYCSQECYHKSREGVARPLVSERMKGNTYRIGLSPGNKFHVVNEDFFKEIDSELKAYWFGVLMADGSMKYGTSGYSMGLGLIDKEHIEQFLKDVGSDAKIGVDNHNIKPWYFTRVNGKVFCTHLYEKGMVPNKTKVLQFPTCVPDELMNHFIRGYWDGDGSFSVNGNEFQAGVVGTFSFISELAKIVQRHCNLKTIRVDCHSNELYLFRKTKLQAKKVCEFLYKDATRFLERKYNKFLTYQALKGGMSPCNTESER